MQSCPRLTRVDTVFAGDGERARRTWDRAIKEITHRWHKTAVDYLVDRVPNFAGCACLGRAGRLPKPARRPVAAHGAADNVEYGWVDQLWNAVRNAGAITAVKADAANLLANPLHCPVQTPIKALSARTERGTQARNHLSLTCSLPFLACSLPFLDLSLPYLACPLPFLACLLPFLDRPLPFLDLSSQARKCARRCGDRRPAAPGARSRSSSTSRCAALGSLQTCAALKR